MSAAAKRPGQIAYEAYRSFSDSKSLVTGGFIPEWGVLRIEIQEAWEAAAIAVLADDSTPRPKAVKRTAMADIVGASQRCRKARKNQ